MEVPYYRIVRFTAPQTYEPTGETWPFNSSESGETFAELNLYLVELSNQTDQLHAAEIVW